MVEVNSDSVLDGSLADHVKAEDFRVPPAIDKPCEYKSRLQVGLVEKSAASDLDTVEQQDLCSAPVSPAGKSAPVLAEPDADPKGVHVDDDGVSHYSHDEGGVSLCILEHPDGVDHALGNPLYDLDKLDRPPIVYQQAGACYAEGVDVSTPDSIARIYHKYSLVDSGHIGSSNGYRKDSLVGNQLGKAQAAFQDMDALAKGADPLLSHVCAQAQKDSDTVEGGYDPLSCAIQLLTEEKAFRHSLESLSMDQRNLVLVFLDKCWCNLSNQTRDQFKSSSPQL